MDIETTERVVFEGLLPIWLLILLGFVLLGTAGWMAKRDCRFTERPKLVPLLLGFRIVSIFVLLWMLAGPTLVEISRVFHTKSIAIFVDTSASMGIVDPIDGSGNTVRWSGHLLQNDEGQLARRLDEILGLLNVAQSDLSTFSRISISSEEVETSAILLNHSLNALEKALTSLKKTISDLPGSHSEMRSNLGGASDRIDQDVLEVIRPMTRAISGGKSLVALNRDQWLPDCRTLLAGQLDTIDLISQQLVSRMETQQDPIVDEQLAKASRLSRLDKVNSWLNSAEQSWLKKIGETTEILRYEFGDSVTPIHQGKWGATDGQASTSSPLSATTHLDAPLQQIAQDAVHKSIEAAIIITDGGHNNAGRHPRDLAAALTDIPLHIIPIGNTRMQRDVILHHTHAPRTVFLDEHR